MNKYASNSLIIHIDTFSEKELSELITRGREKEISKTQDIIRVIEIENWSTQVINYINATEFLTNISFYGYTD